jgi:hypothetical protein
MELVGKVSRIAYDLRILVYQLKVHGEIREF